MTGEGPAQLRPTEGGQGELKYADWKDHDFTWPEDCMLRRSLWQGVAPPDALLASVYRIDSARRWLWGTERMRVWV
jgi:hypothetical protein